MARDDVTRELFLGSAESWDRDIAKNWRKGQIAFNFVYLVAPELADEVRGDADKDPFHRDENLDGFWQHLFERVIP